MISSVNVTEGGALDAETTSDSVIVIYFSKFCCFCCSSVDVLLLYGCQHNSSIGQSSWMSCWLQICYCCLVLFSGMIAYLSPVYEVSPGLHQAFNCPNHTPLHFLNSNFTSKGDRKSVQLKCLDSYNTDQYTECGQAFPGLHIFGIVYHPITIMCNTNCFISGVLITNRTIAYFMCSKTIEHHRLINCTQDTNYTLSSIGDHSLPENSAISSLNALLALGSEKLTYWKYELCFFTSKDLCNYDEDAVNINHFHARRVSSNVWEFSCSNGYKLIGPNTYNCNETNTSLTTYTLKDNCQDCCSPVDLPNVLTSCTSDNFTQLDCENGRFLTGSVGSNKYCSSFLKYHGHSLFSCETCNAAIKYCDICASSSSNEVLCSNCSHPNRYPMKLTKNQKKCKIIALVTSLTFKRTIHNWTIFCTTFGSPKVTSSLYINDIKLVSVQQKQIIFNEPILPYNSSRRIECVATNNWGTDSRHLNLSIISILFDTQHVYTPFPGSRMIMDCVLSGDVVTWNWTFNNTPILPGNDNFNLLSNTSLEIKNISDIHQGMYQCTARNPTEEKSIHKTLYYTKPDDIWRSGVMGYTNTIDHTETGEPPTIIMWTSTYEVVEGSSVVLYCAVTGLPMPVIAWMRNGQFLMVTGVMDGQEICNETSVRLDNVTSDQAGEYKCIAANVNGRQSRSAFLNISQLPRQSFVASLSDTVSATMLTSHVTSSASHVTSSSSRVTIFSSTSTSETTPTSTDIPRSPSTTLMVHIVLIFILFVMLTLFLCILKLVNQKYIM